MQYIVRGLRGRFGRWGERTVSEHERARFPLPLAFVCPEKRESECESRAPAASPGLPSACPRIPTPEPDSLGRDERSETGRPGAGTTAG